MVAATHGRRSHSLTFDEQSGHRGFSGLSLLPPWERKAKWFERLQGAEGRLLGHASVTTVFFIIGLVARGIIEGSKRPFYIHTVPFFGHIAPLYSLKRAFVWI